MATVFKRGGIYYGKYKNERGQWVQRVTNCVHKDAAEAIMWKWQQDAATRRAGVVNRKDEAAAKAAKKPLAQHIDDFETTLKANGRTAQYINETIRYIRDIADDCKWQTTEDIDADDLATHARKLRDAGRSPRTVQAFTTAVKQFAKWLHNGGKLADNPVAGIVRANPESDRRHERRMLLPTEWPWLQRATLKAGDRYGMTGPERLALYDLAIQSGLRSNELRSLSRSSVVLDSERPYVTVKARATKNKHAANQYIRPDLADMLRNIITSKTARSPLFSLPSRWTMADMIREDLATARALWLSEARRDPEEYARRENSDFLDHENESGRKLDFHALRHTCGAWLVSSRGFAATSSSRS